MDKNINTPIERDGIIYHLEAPRRRAMESKEQARRREAAKHTLMMIGMSPNLVGYYYLAEVIAMAAKQYNDGDWLIEISKLEEQVAIAHKKSPAAIERAIRYAISKSYAPEITAARIINTVADLIQ